MTTINPFTPQNVAKKGEAQLSIFYTNDMHGDVNRLAKLKTAKDSFEKANKDNSTLALTSGDCFYGKDRARLGLLTKVINALHLDALTLGNHEFTTKSKGLSEILKGINSKAVSANLEVPEENPLKECIADKKLVKSAVFMKGGHKFAVIGASPFDAEVGADEDKKTGVKVKNADKTIKAIQEEVDKLEKEGINKIVLLSHLGYNDSADLRVARECEGIDIIIGGHTHSVINGVNKETKDEEHPQNIFMSKRGEPIVITQGGKLNKYAGFMDVVFDEKGVIKTDSIKNKLVKVNEFEEDKTVNSMITDALGEKKTLATVKNDYKPACEFEERYTENPIANMYADAVLEAGKDKGVEAVLFGTNTIKKGAAGQITNYELKFDMMPYNSKTFAINMTEKDLVGLLNSTGSKVFKKKDPELQRCAGLKYTLDQSMGDKALTKLDVTDEKGNVIRSIDVNNPSDTKTVKVSVDEFLFYGADSKDFCAKYQDKAEYVGCQHDIFTNYLENKKEIDLAKPAVKDNRITIKYTDLATYCPQYSMEDKINTMNAING